MADFNEFKVSMAKLKLYQMSHGIPQLAQRNHGRVEIKSNDP